MTKLLLSIILSTLALCVDTQAASPLQDSSIKTQSTLSEESTTNEVRWYQVELLIFKQRPISTEIDELWPKDITLSYPDNWETLKTPDQYQALYQKSPLVNTPFILIDKKLLQLAPVKSRLQTNRNEILFHGAWRQSLTQNLDKKNDNATTTILIRGGKTFDDHTELEGSVSLSLLRYLHIDSNLWLTSFVPTGSQPVTGPTAKNESAEQTLVETPVAETAVIETWPALPIYPTMKNKTAMDAASLDVNIDNPAPPVEKKYQVDSIVVNQQSRRMRSYEIHYLDHPKFGILVSFVPLDKTTFQPIPRVQP